MSSKRNEELLSKIIEIGMFPSYATPADNDLDTPKRVAIIMRELGKCGRHAHPQYDSTMKRLLDLWKKLAQAA